MQLRRLTNRQYWNAVGDLLGQEPPRTVELEPDLVSAGFAEVGAGAVATSGRGVTLYEKAAFAAVEPVFGDPAARAKLVGCEPTSPKDPCLGKFFEGFIKRAWRRPVGTSEVTRYLGVVELASSAGISDVWTATQYAVAGILQSPNFLYIIEGAAADASEQRPMTGYELATRISFALTQSTPDAELLRAAQYDELKDEAGIRRQVERLLATPAARAGLIHALGTALGVDRVADVAKDPALFPSFNENVAIAMQQDLEHRLGSLLSDENADFTSLLDSQEVFINDELAPFYGLPMPGSTELVAATLPADSPRRGWLGSVGILAMNARRTMTSPTLRGRYLQTQLLCRLIPEPPPTVNTMLPDIVETGPQTMRQRLEVHQTEPTCAGCHMATDPSGLTFEHFDAVGQYRETDNGLAIDPSGTFDEEPVADAAALATAVRNSPDLPSCIIKHMYRYTLARVETAEERPLLEYLSRKDAATGHRFTEMFISILTSEAFRFGAQTEKP